jgi:hypothetical protein
MKNKKIIINSNINENKGNFSTFYELNKSMSIRNKTNNYYYHTNKTCWENILDFLTYKELTIVAQLNKDLRNISKNHRLLNKFFKEKESKQFIIEKKTNKTSKTHNTNVPNIYNNNITIHSNIKSNNTLENKSLSLEKNEKIQPKNEKKISFYEDYFTKKKINIQSNNLCINKFTQSASVCSSSIGYYDQTPSFSEDNLSNRKSFYNITNITNININQYSNSKFNDS